MGANGPKGAHIPDLLLDPLRDRGVAFTEAEREAHGLTGRLPSAVLTLDQQASRAHEQMQRQPSDLAKNVYLEQLHDRNEILYYKLLLGEPAASALFEERKLRVRSAL
jgi:malate dehydrogenase (oxaloacetate-decarboxylating)